MAQRAQLDDDFYSRALERIQRMMLIIGFGGFIASWAFWGWRVGLGFGLGGAVAFLNFHWLKRIVRDLANLTSGVGGEVSRGVLRRFLLRYFLMAVIAFVILRVSRESLLGLFGGLILPVPAMLCEAAYEAYGAAIGR